MNIKLCVLLCLGCVWRLSAKEAQTALDALKVLPSGTAGQLAIIDGHDGAPAPSRWHFLIHDEVAENGFREFVVQDRAIVASREVSQFVTEVAPDEVVGKGAVKVDSNTVARIVQRYAATNELNVASMNFRLRKDELTAQPVWVVACVDADGTGLATLVVDAGNGRVLGHEGFAVVPPPKTAVKREVALANNASRRSPEWDLPPVYAGPVGENPRVPVRRAEPVRRNRGSLPNPVNDVRSVLRRLFPF